MRVQTLLLVSIGLFAVTCGCLPPQQNRVEESIAGEGGTLSLGGAAVVVPAGTLPSDVLVTLEQEIGEQQLELDENETPVSDVFRVATDQDGVLDSEGVPFRLALPFDTSLVASPLPSDVALLVKIEADEAETEKADAEANSFLMMGTITGGQVEILLGGLPFDARFQVIYNPHRIGIVDEEEDLPKTLTPLPPWETTRWYASVDAGSALVRSTVAAVMGIPEATVTIEDIAHVIKRDVCRNARDAGRQFEDRVTRAPNLDVRTCNDGKKRFVIHVANRPSSFSYPTSENGFGQLNLGSSTLTWAPSYYLGTVKGVIAHELFHACVDGYELKTRAMPSNKRAYSGYNEGMATVVGHTIDNGGVISARENPANTNKRYTMMLNQPLGVCDPRIAGYRNNDFFAYVAKRYGGGSLTYLTGTGADGDGDRNGILEQTRKYLMADTSLIPWVSPVDSFLTAYRMGVHTSFDLQFSSSLAEIYWDFAKNRAYENNEESRLRAEDSSTRWQLFTDRFEAAGISEREFIGEEQSVELSGATVPELRSIQPFSSRALVFTGRGFTADLTLTFETSSFIPDALGNSLRVKVYKNGEDGAEIASGGNTITLGAFGSSFEQAIVLISNVSVDKTYSLLMTAETNAPEEPVPCNPNDPYDRWLIEYDYDCNDTWDSDALWHFLADGGVSHHWLGVIEGYTWSVEDNKIIVSFGPDEGQMEATFSEDCDRMENGTFVGDFALETCWKASQY